MKRTQLWCFVALGALAFGCGSSNDYGDAPEGASRQIAMDIDVGPAPSQVIVLVLDDRSDAEELRQLVELELESFASRSLSIAPVCATMEPTRTHPIDISLVVAHPSALGDARFVGPASDANLRWREADATLAGRLAWIEAVRRAVGETHAEGPFAALEAMKSVLDLLKRERVAQTDAESALFASVPSDAERKTLVLAAHEDESPGETSAYAALPAATSDVFDTLLFPSAAPIEPPEMCRASSEPGSPRFELWRAAQHVSSPMLWPCNGLRLLQSSTEACAPRCVNWHPLEEDDGRATCRILVDAEVERCDAAQGWLDPEDENGVRRPVQPTPTNPALRTCEIQQLSGAALASCKTSLSCPDCQPGWCATKVPDLLDQCAYGAPLPLRFVGGADVVARGVASVLCNVSGVAN